MAAVRRLRATLAALALLGPAPAARADTVTVMISGGFKSTFEALVPQFEKQTGHHVVTVPGASMGTTPTAIPVRLAKGEPDDVLVMVGYALDALQAAHAVAPGSRVTLADSAIGMAVRAGTPVPDISTPDKLRAVLLAAPSVAYSDSASGVYIQAELFNKLGIAAQMAGKARQIPGTPVGEIVARGEAAVGFQQVAELLPVPGIAFAGRLPAELQSITAYAAGVSAHAAHPAAARALIAFLAGPEARPVLARMGLDPAAP